MMLSTGMPLVGVGRVFGTDPAPLLSRQSQSQEFGPASGDFVTILPQNARPVTASHSTPEPLVKPVKP